MKQVILAQPMRGVGDSPVLPDDVADRMVKSGEALSAEPWPPRAPAHQAETPKRPIVKSERPIVKPARPSGELDLRIAR